MLWLVLLTRKTTGRVEDLPLPSIICYSSNWSIYTWRCSFHFCHCTLSHELPILRQLKLVHHYLLEGVHGVQLDPYDLSFHVKNSTLTVLLRPVRFWPLVRRWIFLVVLVSGVPLSHKTHNFLIFMVPLTSTLGPLFPCSTPPFPSTPSSPLRRFRCQSSVSLIVIPLLR